MTDLDDWTMAQRIADNNKTFRTPQEALAAFEDLMKQVQAESDKDD